MYRIKIIILCSILIIPIICFGETTESKTPFLANAGSHMSFSYVMQILVSFLLVIGFILALAWFMKKSGRLGYGSGQAIRIKSSLSLGMREKIIVVEVGATEIIVGVAPGQIRTLHVLEGGSQSDDPLNAGDAQSKTGFKQLMDKFSKQ